jgi:hypothetical protein
VSADRFVAQFAAGLRGKASDFRIYGATDTAQAFERIAQELEDAFRSWWLESLTVAEAAAESGYSEERLREMAREGLLPHAKGDGSRGHLRIARCDLPRRPVAHGRAPTLSGIAERLLGPKRPHVLRGRG